MTRSSVLRAAFAAFIAFAAVLSPARADEGFVTLTIYKAGWIIGGSGGSGVLNFRGRPRAQHLPHHRRRRRRTGGRCC